MFCINIYFAHRLKTLKFAFKARMKIPVTMFWDYFKNIEIRISNTNEMTLIYEYMNKFVVDVIILECQF